MEQVVREKKAKVVSVSPFVVEADNPRNCDLYIQTLGGMRLRSSIKATKEVFDREDGEQVTRPAPAKMIDGLPRDLPGMRLHIYPAECKWKMVDPLRDNQEVMDKVKRAIQSRTSTRTTGTLRGVPPAEGNLGIDEMKTLLKEMLCLIENQDMRVIKGVAPTKEEVDDMPGRYLLNWSNRGQWNQPRYEDEFEDWKRLLNRVS
jgi:hypothetical protein